MLRRAVDIEGRGSRRMRPGLVAAGAAVVALVATSCAFLPVPLPARDTTSNGGPPCADASMRSCALPYPSDEFTVADSSTETGVRVEMPEGVIDRAARDRLGPGATVEDAFGGADGFSAVTPVIFELDRSVDPSSMPADGGDVIAVFDVATGARVPIRAEISKDSIRFGAMNTIVMAWPTVRFDYGHTYVARLNRGLHANVGELATAPGIATVSSEYVAGIRSALRAIEGDRWSDVISATTFTVRSRANANHDLVEMARLARADDHPVRNLEVGAPFLVTDASAVVHGEVRLTDFRDDDGVADPANGPTEIWERFLMVLPKSPAGPDGAPVAVYGHGLTVSKETMVAVASANARRGVATVGVDVPNHGERQDEGGFLLDITHPETFGRLTSMTLQGEVDNLSMMKSVEQHFGDLRFDAPLLGSAPPRLDTSRVLYEGTSMGGVLGAAEVPLAPELDGAFLQVPGVGTVDIIVHSALWPLFMRVVPDGIPAGDAAALIGAAGMLLDRSDAVNVLDADHAGAAPIFAQYGVGDGIVPGFSTSRLMTLLDLPLIGPDLTPVLTPVRRLPTNEVPADGWGAEQVWNTQSSVELMALGGHLSFMDPVAQKLFDEWLVNRLSASGIPPSG